MANITAAEVNKLRQTTGAGMMDCKKALVEAEGNFDTAIEILRKKGQKVAANRADRDSSEGAAIAVLNSDNTQGVAVSLNCETDFVAKNDEFKALARDVAMHATAMNPKFIRKDQITEEVTQKAKETFADEVKDKPADLQEKILQGKLDAYFNEQVLLEQAFIKNPETTIGGMIESAIQKFGEKVDITDLARFEV